jgi:putative transposase
VRPGHADLERRIKEICQTGVRYGYRHVHLLLRREGWLINQKKTRRICRELGLQLPKKTPKRRVKAKLRDDRRPATRFNETWAMDFVHDQLATPGVLRMRPTQRCGRTTTQLCLSMPWMLASAQRLT